MGFPRKRALPAAWAMLMILAAPVVSSASNPFMSGAEPQRVQPSRPPMFEVLTSWQQELRAELAAYLQTDGENSARGGHVGGRAVPIVLLAFAYGFLHALGPGHRKTVVFSYFLQEDAGIATGVLAGLLMSALHAGTAVLLVLGLHAIVHHSVTSLVDRAGSLMEALTGSAVLLYGLIRLVGHLGAALRGRRSTVGETAAVGRPGAAAAGKPIAPRRLFIPAASAGLVPCPGVSMVMLLSLSLGVVRLGVTAALAMSVGMALTLSIVALATSAVRRGAVHRAGDTRGHVIHAALEITGAAAMVVFGIGLLL